MLLPIGFQRADPCVLAAAFGLATERVRFMTASRPSVISPTHFVQQVNTVSAFTASLAANTNKGLIIIAAFLDFKGERPNHLCREFYFRQGA